jgi:hypothetical protein
MFAAIARMGCEVRSAETIHGTPVDWVVAP